jgi:hypothetical protein
MWEGCVKSFAATTMDKRGKTTIGNSLEKLLRHEAQHSKGDATAFKGFECPEDDCTFTDLTSAPVWAHATEAHGIKEDPRRCLWVRCGRCFNKQSDYQRHEGMHTGVFPFKCPACGKGHGDGSQARACCAVGAACRCGTVFKGRQAKRSFDRHQKKCKKGAAPLPA